jgi:hypothetical protein
MAKLVPSECPDERTYGTGSTGAVVKKGEEVSFALTEDCKWNCCMKTGHAGTMHEN